MSFISPPTMVKGLFPLSSLIGPFLLSNILYFKMIVIFILNE